MVSNNSVLTSSMPAARRRSGGAFKTSRTNWAGAFVQAFTHVCLCVSPCWSCLQGAEYQEVMSWSLAAHTHTHTQKSSSTTGFRLNLADELEYVNIFHKCLHRVWTVSLLIMFWTLKQERPPTTEGKGALSCPLHPFGSTADNSEDGVCLGQQLTWLKTPSCSSAFTTSRMLNGT